MYACLQWSELWDMQAPYLVSKSPANMMKIPFIHTTFSKAAATRHVVVIKVACTTHLHTPPRTDCTAVSVHFNDPISVMLPYIHIEYCIFVSCSAPRVSEHRPPEEGHVGAGAGTVQSQRPGDSSAATRAGTPPIHRPNGQKVCAACWPETTNWPLGEVCCHIACSHVIPYQNTLSSAF
jgi:hypothetical protein